MTANKGKVVSINGNLVSVKFEITGFDGTTVRANLNVTDMSSLIALSQATLDAFTL